MGLITYSGLVTFSVTNKGDYYILRDNFPVSDSHFACIQLSFLLSFCFQTVIYLASLQLYLNVFVIKESK